jgi:hypothetical protein
MQRTALLLTVAAATSANAQLIDDTIPIPSLDRWMYPFNGEPGAKLEIQTFGAAGIEGFDDMDGQMIVGFDTTELVPAGLGADKYRIGAIILTTTNVNGDVFEYDPTYDSYKTLLDPGDPDFIPDEDPGWSINVYAVGYRGGFDLASFEEDTDFGDIPPDFNTEGVRNAYAALFDGNGDAFDVSRFVKQRFEAPPLATGIVDGLTPGTFVPADSLFEFDTDICTPGFRGYVKASLDLGKLNLAVTSLVPAAKQDPEGLPRWYSKENPLALPPFDRTATLTLVVLAGDYGDFDGNGEKNILDFVAFQQAFVGGDPLADANEDCQLNILDFVAFQQAFQGS